jgi:hypothetical protein
MKTILQAIKEKQRQALEERLELMKRDKATAIPVIMESLEARIEQYKKGLAKFPGETRGYYKKYLLMDATEYWTTKVNGEYEMCFRIPSDKPNEEKYLQVQRETRFNKLMVSIHYSLTKNYDNHEVC